MRVILVDMPFAAAERPSLGLGLLKSALAARGIACDVAYPKLDFARRIGLADYRRIAGMLPEYALAGEWVFSEAVFGADAEPLEEFGAFLLSRHNQPLEVLGLIRRVQKLAGEFIDDFVASVSWSDYRVVGFTSCCHQNLAALAAARRIKGAFPEITIAFGGPNWDGEMGLAQLSHFDFVDFVCLGEAERSFPDAVEYFSGAQGSGARPLPGVARRLGGGVHVDEGDWRTSDLNDLPHPNLEDFFDQLAASGFDSDLCPAVSVEASRGCWWVRRGPCTFCGQNGSLRGYREKTPERTVGELESAGLRCPAGTIDLTDNVVSRRFLREVLPRLRDTPVGGRLFFEARPTLTKEEVAMVGVVGSGVQFGIESLCDHVLGLMRKGTSALENIRLLKWCRSFGVRPVWNLLYGVPGETADDLRETLRLLPSLSFLQPPRNCGPITVDRFSAYFQDTETFGLRNVRPLPGYRHAYPMGGATLGGLAYSFEFDMDEPDALGAYRLRLRTETAKWRNRHSRGEPRLTILGDGIAIVDSRPDVDQAFRVLDPLDLLVVEACEDICERDELLYLAGERLTLGDPIEDVETRLIGLEEDRLIVAMGERYLSLVLPPREEAERFKAASMAATAGRMPRA